MSIYLLIWLLLVLFLYLCHGLVLSLGHVEVSKDYDHEDHSGVEPEQAVQPNAGDDVAGGLDGGKAGDHLKAEDDAAAKTPHLRREHFSLQNDGYGTVAEGEPNVEEDDENQRKYLHNLWQII